MKSTTNRLAATDSRNANTHTWLTPEYFFSELGNFDLDPCAAPEPRPFPTAKKMLSLPKHDGLKEEWKGRIWLNPPYGSHTPFWLKKLKEHNDGIALVFARTDTKWFQEIMQNQGVFLLKGRIKFLYPDGTVAENSSSTPSCLIPFGKKNIAAILASNLEGIWKQ